MASTPAIASVTVTGAWAAVSFSDADWSTYQSYTVTLQSVNVPALTWQFPPVTPAAGQMVAGMSLSSLSPAFDPTQTYNVTVAGSPGGPSSSPSQLPFSVPALGWVAVSPVLIGIAWSDVYPPSGVDHYTATLWKAGGIGENFPDVAAGLPMMASMPPPAGGLNPASAYTVNVTRYASSGLATGPSAAVVVAATTGTVMVTGDLKALVISALPPPLPPAWTGFAFQLLDGDTPIATSEGPDRTLWLLPSPLQEGRRYSLAVAGLIADTTGGGCTSRGPFGPRTAVIAEAPSLVGAPTFDGAVLKAAWTRVQDPAVIGYAVQVTGAGDPLLFITGVETTLAVPAAVGGADTLSVAAIGPASTGPVSAAAAVLAVAPELTSVQYAAGTITAAWTLASEPAGASYELALFDGGSQIASTTGTTSTGGTISAALQPGRSYTVRARVLVSGSTGPWSGAGAVITTAPAVTSTRYDGTSVAATWGALADPAVTGYPATLSEVGGSPVGDPVATGGTSAVIPAGGVTAGKSYQVTVQAIGHTAVGPAGAPLAAVIETVALAGVRYDAGSLQLTWGAASAGGAGYLVEVLENGAVIASQASAQTSASLAIALGGTSSYAARVRVVAGAAAGAPGPEATVLAATTFVTQGTTDPILGLTSFAWAPLPGAASYLLQAYVGGLPSGAPLPVAGTQYTFPVALVRDSDFAVAVAGVATSGAATVTGPYGPRFFPPTIQPVVLAASYNGVSASISWNLVEGATGYRVSVLQGGASQPVAQRNLNAVTHSTVISPTITDPTKSYGTVVQALVGSDSGPPSAQQPIFAPGYFLSTQPAATYAPFIYPAPNLALVRSSNLGQTGATAQIYLPDLAGTGTLQLPFTQGPFQLTANTSSASKGTFPVVLTIPGNSSAWAFQPSAIRASLQQDYVAFLELAETKGAVPEGIATLQQVISRYMPQTFAETLYYAYGLSLGASGWVDLRPGMVLRVASGDYMKVSDQQLAAWMDGYAVGAVVDYDVGSYLSSEGKWLLGLDAFIAQLVASGAMEVAAPQASGTDEAGVADAADLFFEDFDAPFYRLFFPGDLQTPSGPGSPVPASNFALAAAASYTALDQSSNVPSATNLVAYFRGRAVVRPCIRVTVNGAERVVPVGTTVRNALEQLGWSPPSTGVGLEGVVLERALGPVVLDPGVRFDVGLSYRVRLDWDTLPVYAPGLDGLSLPLLHGDRLLVD